MTPTLPGWIALLALGAAAATAADAPIWQIGAFDRSSAEFRPWIDPVTGARFDYADPRHDFVYRVGQSSPGHDWPAYQPGSANGGAGFRSHPATIEFVLPNPTATAYRLELSLLAYSARLPVVQVEVNGQRGWFYQNPRLEYGGGDPGVFFLPYYSAADLSCELPAGSLRAGTNVIVLTALDEPNTRDDTRPAGFAWPGSSGIHYDALRLEAQAIGDAPLPSVRVEPSVLFPKVTPLRQALNVTLSSFPLRERTRVALALVGKEYTQSFDPGRAFGQWRLEFLADELVDPVEAEVTVESDGQVWRSTTRVAPAKKWTVFVVPNVHLDVGYTDYAAKVAEIQSRILDRAVEWSEREPDFRFTPDGFWCVEEYWHGRGPGERQRLVDAMRRGAISLPAVYGSPFTGFASLENMIRLLYPSHQFAVDHGLPLEVALNTDVPSYSWSFASVLAAAGIRYFVAASDAYRGPFLLENRLHERSPLWWEGPDGGRVLTWYSRHYHQLASLFGLPPEISSGRDSLPRFLQAYEHPGYRANAVIFYGSQAENGDLHPGQISVVRDWNNRYAYPELKFATFNDALHAITNQWQGDLPVIRGDGGPYWEDGLGANARTTALARQNMRRILSAEKAGTLAALAAPGTVPDQRVLRAAWRNLLLTDEHTWHADCSVREPQSQQSVRQGAEKDARAAEAQRQIDHLLERGLAALADQVQAPAGTVLVFNPLSWARDGWVELDVPKGARLQDVADGAWAPDEVTWTGHQIERLRVLVRAVPAVGYRCLRIAREAPRRAVEEEIRDGVLEDESYRLELEPGTGRIVRLRDKAAGRELVSSSVELGFNQYLYVEGGDELPNRLVQYSTVSPLPRLTTHRARASRLVLARRSELGLAARIESSAENTPRITADLLLVKGTKRIEIHNRLAKLYTERKEAAYFAFPFDIPSPRFRYGTANGVIDPQTDLLPGAGREWFCLQDWMAVDGAGVSVGLALVDAPLVTLGDIARGAWPREFGERPGRVFSYVMNNYTPEGYQAGQGGEFTFRYVLTSAAELDAVTLYRLGAEAATPLEINLVTGNDKASPDRGWLPGTNASLLELNAPHVALVTWKLAERGAGTVLRLLETGGRSGQIEVRLPFHRIVAAWQCNALEEDVRRLPNDDHSLTIAVKPSSIQTIRLELAFPAKAKLRLQ